MSPSFIQILHACFNHKVDANQLLETIKVHSQANEAFVYEYRYGKIHFTPYEPSFSDLLINTGFKSHFFEHNTMRIMPISNQGALVFAGDQTDISLSLDELSFFDVCWKSIHYFHHMTF